MSQVPSGLRNNGGRARQDDFHRAAASIHTISNLDPAAVSFRDLARKNESHAAAIRFGCIERSEHVGRVHEAGTVVVDGEDDVLGIGIPVNFDMLV